MLAVACCKETFLPLELIVNVAFVNIKLRECIYNDSSAGIVPVNLMSLDNTLYKLLITVIP